MFLILGIRETFRVLAASRDDGAPPGPASGGGRHCIDATDVVRILASMLIALACGAARMPPTPQKGTFTLRARGLLALLPPGQDTEHKEHEDLPLFLLVQIFVPRPHNLCRTKG